MCTVNNTRGRLFGCEGCQVPIGKGGVCGETRTLDIVNEFRRLYEEKMQEIDANGGGECLQEKFRLQQEWIGDLTEQNEMLVKAVEELEHEATERVKLLEEKLQQSAQCICEVMNRYREFDPTNMILEEPLKRIFNLENDQRNLLELIRRIREEGLCTLDGLTFYEVSFRDILGDNNNDSKFRYQAASDFKVEKLIMDKEGTIKQLQSKIDYVNTFGDVEVLNKELKARTVECETLKQAMLDMRLALTEEVASKHDTILQMKRDCHELEEKCIQADKQTAFKDDIIKELRKEIKHLRQQVNQEEISKLNQTIDELKSTLQKTKQIQEEEDSICKICKANPKVGFVSSEEVQTNLDDDQMDGTQLQKQDDNSIKNQSNTLKLLQDEMDSLKKEKEIEMMEMREKQNREIQRLKNQVSDLQSSLQDSENRATNLQMAVDLYLNSINVLETTEEKYKIEIEQQKATIANLQNVLVAVKQELDDLKSKTDDSEMEQHILINNCVSLLTNKENEKDNLTEKLLNIYDVHRKLQDLNFNLELEHCKSLQDVDVLDNQLSKYQFLLRSTEIDNNKYKKDMKKLLKQKKCYEEVIIYFKEEMALMSDQLHNLQELLTLSNESVQEENSNLMQAFLDVQTANENLTRQLGAAEQKVLLENQMNLLNESKINELERMISDKEIDLGRHDKAIMSIRETLASSMKQNEELHGTIVALNGTICQLQCAIKKYERDNCMSKESTTMCQTQISACKQKLCDLKSLLDQKTTELCKLEMAYNNQSRCLQTAQLELKEMKEKQSDKQSHMRMIMDELKSKLTEAEGRLKAFEEENAKLQNHLALVVRRETIKDVEIKRYRKIIGDLKKTLIDLNKALTNKKFQSKCTNAECNKNMNLSDISDQDLNDVCLNCPCEVEFYQNLVETLKGTVLNLKEKLSETQKSNQQLEEENKEKEIRLAQLAKCQQEKDKEYNDLRQKFADKLQKAQAEESRYLELASQFEKELGSLRQELEIRTMQLNDVKKNCHEIHSSRCVQLACAQEEVSSLKLELNNLLAKHCALNVENEKLHNQSARMQATVSNLEKKSQLLTTQLEQYLIDLQALQYEKESLVQKNRELLNELRSLQSSYTSADKQQRYMNDECTIKWFEGELFKVKNSRDDICAESKNVVNYFRAWLQEQKKINEHVMAREKYYVDIIEKLKRDNHDIQYQYAKRSPKPCGINTPCRSPMPNCQSPWSMDSQCSASVNEYNNSPLRSPCLNEDCDWYSTTFKNDSEDEDEEDWVSRVEDLAAQVRRTNKMWKNKIDGNADYTVTKDHKK